VKVEVEGRLNGDWGVDNKPLGPGDLIGTTCPLPMSVEDMTSGVGLCLGTGVPPAELVFFRVSVSAAKLSAVVMEAEEEEEEGEESVEMMEESELGDLLLLLM